MIKSVYMKCPTDNVDLLISERQGIEIDYCPTCRGVWLDRGELDKLIERSSAPVNTSSDHSMHTRQHEQHPYPNKHHKREGFLGEIFDF